LITIYNIVKCKLDYLWHHTFHSLWLLTWGLCVGFCYYSSIFIPCLAFRIHVASDLNQKLSFVASVFLHCVRSRFIWAHPLEPELLSAIRHLSIFNIIHIRLNVFFWNNRFAWSSGFQLFCTAGPRCIVAIHYTKDPHLKLDQTKCITAVCIKKSTRDPSKNGSRPIWALFPQKNVH